VLRPWAEKYHGSCKDRETNKKQFISHQQLSLQEISVAWTFRLFELRQWDANKTKHYDVINTFIVNSFLFYCLVHFAEFQYIFTLPTVFGLLSEHRRF